MKVVLLHFRLLFIPPQFSHLFINVFTSLSEPASAYPHVGQQVLPGPAALTPQYAIFLPADLQFSALVYSCTHCTVTSGKGLWLWAVGELVNRTRSDKQTSSGMLG